MALLQKALAMDSRTRRRLLDVAQGRQPADLWLRGARVLNVFTEQLERVDIAIAAGRIATLSAPAAGAQCIHDLPGQILLPGLIEPHNHSALLVSPTQSAPQLLASGTTTLFEDTLPYLSDLGVDGFWPFVDALAPAPRRFWLTRVRPSSPLPNYPTIAQLAPILENARCAGLMEVTAWSELLEAPTDIFDCLSRAPAGRFDGHLAGASVRRLAQLALTGIDSCHEATTADEAFARLRLGLWTALRGSSLRPDLRELCALITRERVPTHRLLFTTDGLSADDLAEGHLDALVNDAVAAGVPPITALVIATRNAASYYGIDAHLGALSPGRIADIVTTADLRPIKVVRTYVAGDLLYERGVRMPPGAPLPPYPAMAIPPASALETALAAADAGALHLESAAITRWGLGPGPCVRLLLVGVDRPVCARASGFGCPGAIATTFTLARTPLILGTREDDMRLAYQTLQDLGGGLVLAHEGQVSFALALPFGGSMTDAPLSEVSAAASAFKKAWRELGYSHGEALYTLLFLTGDFLPDARLTRLGLFDVKSRTVKQAP